jgi:hypothetical protein
MSYPIYVLIAVSYFVAGPWLVRAQLSNLTPGTASFQQVARTNNQSPLTITFTVDAGTQEELILCSEMTPVTPFDSVSWQLPSGQVLTSSQSGYEIGAGDQTEEEDGFAAFFVPPGRHWFIKLPANAPPGPYRAQFASFPGNNPSIYTCHYMSSSDLGLAVGLEPVTVAVGAPAKIYAALRNGSVPITNAAVSAKAAAEVPATGSITLAAVSQTPQPGGIVRELYSVSFHNGSADARGVLTVASGAPEDVTLNTDHFYFGDLTGGQTAACPQYLEFDRPSTLQFNPNTLRFTNTEATVPVALTFVHQADGIYESTLTPTQAGSYRIIVTAAGVRDANIAFQRTQTSLLEVTAPQAVPSRPAGPKQTPVRRPPPK